MNNNEKIDIINDHIKSILLHLVALENDIFVNPLGDIEGKLLRSQVLSDFISKKDSLELEKESLTNQV
jgi:hypothetical protein